MTTNPIAIDPSLTLRQFVDEYMFRFNFKAYPLLAADQQLTGCITTRQVRAIPRANWDSWTVGEVARNCPEDATITPDGDALSAIARMARGGRSRLLVVENGRLLGAVTYKDLMDFLAGKLELEGKRVPSHMRHAARAAHARPPVS